jgi:transposase
MPRRPAAYPAASREQIIALVCAGRSPKELAKELEPSEQTIRNWAFQDGADRGERPEALTTEERAELQRLRRENRQLKVERDILGIAAAWFARESGTIPPESSSS